jgi:hypothetical protein
MVELDQITLLVSTVFKNNSYNSSRSLLSIAIVASEFPASCLQRAALVWHQFVRWQDRRMQLEPFKDVTSCEIYPGIFPTIAGRRFARTAHGHQKLSIGWRENYVWFSLKKN